MVSTPRLLLFLLLSAVPAAAGEPANEITLVAPYGGQPVPLPGPHRVLCSDGAQLAGWTIETEGRHLRPPLAPPEGEAGGIARLRLAADAAACAHSTEVLRAMAIVAYPQIEPSSVVYNLDAGRLDVRGHGLRNIALFWRQGERHGTDVCHDPGQEGSAETCAFIVSRDVLADADSIALRIAPAVASEGEVDYFERDGSLLRAEHFTLTVARLVLDALFAADAAVNNDIEVTQIPLVHPHAVGGIDCTDALCDLEGGALLVRGEHGLDDRLEARVRLRPHVFLRQGVALDATPLVLLPIQRCPVSLASGVPLRGTAGQKLVVKVGGRCAKDPSLRYWVGGSPAKVMSSRNEGDSLYVVLQPDTVGGDEVVVAMQRGATVMGLARSRTRALSGIRARLELDGGGSVDFIPTNREAQVQLPALADGGTLVPLPVDGVYSVTRTSDGSDRVRGLDGATGWVQLRLALRERSLPPALRDLNLAEVSDSIGRSVHVANVPVHLGASVESESPIAELLCGGAGGTGGEDGISRLRSGSVSSIPYTARDSCRLVLHAERLRPEDGEQILRLTVTVVGADGISHAESALDQRLRLGAGPEPRLLYLTGVTAPFDRVVVRLAVLTDDPHYGVRDDERLVAPQAQWSVIMGTNKLRLYTTSSIPSGLFRLAAGPDGSQHSGIMGLNSGALVRLVTLTVDGQPSPLGLEAGVMWVGIAGDTAAAHSQIALVAGLGISVPFANVSRLTQAAVAIHAWAEYEISRAVTNGPGDGSPWALVFGPSITLGNIGFNL